MSQPGDGSRLAEQARALSNVRRAVSAPDELEGDLPVELPIVRRVDLAHCARPEQCEDSVTAEDASGRDHGGVRRARGNALGRGDGTDADVAASAMETCS